MSAPQLEVTDNPGTVWRVGFAPDMWQWTPWAYATDSGLFNGRWDDQMGQFRTLYTSSSLLGCFLELLAPFRPSALLDAALGQIDDDDATVSLYPDAPSGSVGHRWLEDRLYGAADQDGRYCFITHSRSIAALQLDYPLARHGLGPSDVDTALLKDARDRKLTRSIARWLYNLQAPEGGELVSGVEFRSRFGDEIAMWAVFERSRDERHSRHIRPANNPAPIPDDLPELVEAFEHHGLSWAH